MIIPLRIRTARKRQRCDDYLHPCGGWIEPGERYEDHRTPPGSYDWGDSDHWRVAKIHAPHFPASGPTGCELAGAYREHAAREAAS